MINGFYTRRRKWKIYFHVLEEIEYTNASNWKIPEALCKLLFGVI